MVYLEGDVMVKKGFGVSYTSTKSQALLEMKQFQKSGKGNYSYFTKQNPDKKGWTVFAFMKKR